MGTPIPWTRFFAHPHRIKQATLRKQNSTHPAHSIQPQTKSTCTSAALIAAATPAHRNTARTQPPNRMRHEVVDTSGSPSKRPSCNANHQPSSTQHQLRKHTSAQAMVCNATATAHIVRQTAHRQRHWTTEVWIRQAPCTTHPLWNPKAAGSQGIGRTLSCQPPLPGSRHTYTQPEQASQRPTQAAA
jgi:hypothetical protein